MILYSFPAQWLPEVVILEGMFLINTAPLITHSTMQDYARFLIKCFAVPHFVKGVREVHIIFDNPGCIANTPKAVEQRRRDNLHTPPAEHEHYEFYNLTTVPSKWRDCLHCHHCKRRLVLYLGQAFQKIAADYLHGQQELVIAGCFGGEHSKNAIGITQFSCNTIPALLRSLTLVSGCMHFKVLAIRN